MLHTIQNASAFISMTPDEALSTLGSSRRGLSSSEVAERFRQFGENVLQKRNRLAWTSILLHQFTDVIVWILLLAAGFSLVFAEFGDAAIILVIVIVNAGIGFIQEYKAEPILDRLRALATDRVIVIRDGSKSEIDSRLLVPGDLIVLDAGTTVPADARIIECFSFKVNTSVMTGESKARTFLSEAAEIPESIVEARNLILSGEAVVSGDALAIVVATGSETELGRLATTTENIREELTPLQRKMERLGRHIGILSLVIGAFVITIGHASGLSWYDTFFLALALAVSVVPEGLPAAISIAFALGMRRLLKSGMLAKRLSSVETLGSVTAIATDKTGTLTRGELVITQIITAGGTFEVSGEGYEPHGGFFREGRAINSSAIPNLPMILKIGTLANDADLTTEHGRTKVLGDGTEGALLVVARKYNPDPDFFRIGERKLLAIPFTSERKRMSVLYENSHRVSFVKGSPDILLSLVTRRLDENGREIPFTETDKEFIRQEFDRLSDQALRLLALCYRTMEDIPVDRCQEEMERDLVWAGMVAMSDPPRTGTREAVEECRHLGIRVLMITGDYELTARAVAREVGIIRDEEPYALIGSKAIDELSDEALFATIRKQSTVFARTTPAQKLRIARVLREQGEVVAMTGDGVNDAPALKRADIGIAMGIAGTDVSKEAADMILLDDRFESIVRGVREGRTIFANLRKFAHYVFTSNASELMTVLAGFALGIPSPIAAIQIIAIDLGTDVFPSLALGVEPEEPNSATQKEKNIRSIIGGRDLLRILRFGFLMAIAGISAFLLSLLRGGWIWGTAIDTDSDLYMKSTTATYLTLALTQMANLLQSRSTTIPFFQMPFRSNPWIWVALTGSVVLLWIFTSTAPVQNLLSMRTPDIFDWIVALSFTLLLFFMEESRKRHLMRSSSIGD